MAPSSDGLPDTVADALLRWAWQEGVVGDTAAERRLAAMRLEKLACAALPHSPAADVVLTVQWTAFVCWVDDEIDRQGLGSRPEALLDFTASLRHALTGRRRGGGTVAGRHAGVLARLVERTDPGRQGRWRERFAAHYTDFLDATEEEVALRRAGTRLQLGAYVGLRRRTITMLPLLDVLERTGRTVLAEDPGVDAELSEIREAAADIAGWANDLASQDDDQSVGQDNLVTVLAHHDHTSLAAARVRAATMIHQRHRGLTAAASRLRAASGLPPEQHEQLRGYVDVVERITAANLHWLAGSGRYTPDAALDLGSIEHRPTAPEPSP